MKFILRRYNKIEFRFYKNVKETPSFIIFEDSENTYIKKFMIFYKFTSEYLLLLFQEEYTEENRNEIFNKYNKEYLKNILKENLNENEIQMIKGFKEEIKKELIENINKIDEHIEELTKEKETNNVLLISLSVNNSLF